jgi:hypothetical protein
VFLSLVALWDLIRRIKLFECLAAGINALAPHLYLEILELADVKLSELFDYDIYV